MRLELKIRDLEMPAEASLYQLSNFLVDFYKKNIIHPDQLKFRYDVFYEFKRKFIRKFPSIQNILRKILHRFYWIL